MTPRELGPYLLLRKLSEDALSEIYRAGQKSGDDVERVVLLCFFKAKRDDATWLAETATVGRRALKGLSSPFLGEVVDSGEEAGSAYLSYEYISGVGLQEIIGQARQSGAPVPLEVALHIVDRIAAGLLAAWEHESRMLHGFVVPQLVRLSNEGEVRLLGIEVASRLRRLLTDPELEAEVRSYLAPEVVPQSQAATTDDVYSLGSLLYTLVTGKSLSPGDDPLARVGEATTANGKPLPEEIRTLLRTSLAPAPSRARLPEWRAELHDLMLSESYDATSFNLAVYLHQLFGERLEEGSDATGARTATPVATTRSDEAAAGQDESPSVVASGQAGGGAPIEPIEPIDEPPAAPIETADDVDIGADAPEGSDRRFLAAAAVVVLLVAAGAGFYLTRSNGPDVEQAATSPALELPVEIPVEMPAESTAVPAPPPADAESAEPVDAAVEIAGSEAAPTPTREELDQRVEELVARQSKAIEGALRDEYEREIAQLKSQLEELATTKETPPATPDGTTDPPGSEAEATSLGVAARRTGSEPAAGTEPPPGTAIEPSAASTATSPGDEEPVVPTATSGAGAAGANPPDDTDVSQSVSEPAESAAVEPEPEGGEAAVGRPELGGGTEGTGRSKASETASSGASASEPASEAGDEAGATAGRSAATETATETAAMPSVDPPVRLGQLVTVGPGVVSPELETSVQPVYPMVARRLGRSAVVDLRVLIDENGEVVEVEQVSSEAGFGFDAAARDAARRMKWKPATKNGVRVKVWWPVRIAFQP